MKTTSSIVRMVIVKISPPPKISKEVNNAKAG